MSNSLLTTHTVEMHEDEDDYTKFSPNNMMKVTDFQPMSAAEQAELDALLIASV